MPEKMRANFESGCLYDHLGVSKAATSSDIRKAYYRLALQYHPDRNPSAGTVHFQQIGRAYEILIDEQSRQLYDETGVINTENLSEANFEAYFREMFHRVRMEDIDAFKVGYVGSVEEYEDVLASYKTNRGNIEAIVDDVFFGDDEGAIDRFTAIIQRAISKGIIDQERSFEKIVSSDQAKNALKTKRKKRAEKEAKEAEALAKELGLDKDLKSVIQSRHKDHKDRFDTLLAGLEAKYASKQKKSKTKQ